jgi:hypothetical protein
LKITIFNGKIHYKWPSIPSTDLHWFSARLPQLHRFAPQRRPLRAQRLAGAAVRGGLLGEVPGASDQRSSHPLWREKWVENGEKMVRNVRK